MGDFTKNKHTDFYEIPDNTWDETFDSEKNVRNGYKRVVDYLDLESTEELNKKEELSKLLFMSQGITFTVYNSGEGVEKIFPFDIVPRIISSKEWTFIERGIKQRVNALYVFLKDVYSDQFIIKDGIVPIDIIYSCPHFLREMVNIKVPHDIYPYSRYRSDQR